MEATIRHTLTREIRGLVAERLGDIASQYPHLRRAYLQPYGDPRLDAVREEAARCAILGLYQATQLLVDRLLLLMVGDTADSDITECLDQARSSDILIADEAERIVASRKAILHAVESGTDPSSAARSYLLTVDSVARRTISRAAAA